MAVDWRLTQECAWVDVEVSEEQRKEMSGGGGEWFQFRAIGDKLYGRLDAYEERDSRLNPGKKDHNYTVTTPEGRTLKTTATHDLQVKLQKAMRPPDGTSKGGLGLKPGVGHRICATYTSNQDVGQDSPMKVFRLQVDTAPAQGQAQTQQRQPAAQTRAMPVRDQDILGPADPPQSAQRTQGAPAARNDFPTWDDLP